MNRRVFIAQAALCTLSACALGRSADDEPAYYDFGIEPPAAIDVRLSRGLALDEVSAAAWLQTQAILYRLAYRDPAQLQAYSRSRWTAPPAVLVTQRLRIALSQSSERGVTMASDALGGNPLVRVGIDAFEQMVDSANSSRAIVTMHASLVDASRKLQAQRALRIERPCPSVDARGAVRGLLQATDASIAEVIGWLAATMRA